MYKVNNVVITNENKTIIVSCDDYYNNKSLFVGVIGRKMINKLTANNINFTLIEE